MPLNFSVSLWTGQKVFMSFFPVLQASWVQARSCLEAVHHSISLGQRFLSSDKAFQLGLSATLMQLDLNTPVFMEHA